jgi:hypothetical protein
MQALPIDDVIMPKIESGRWQPYPYVPRAQQHPGGAHYASSVENKKRFESGRLHQLPQVHYMHARACQLLSLLTKETTTPAALC